MSAPVRFSMNVTLDGCIDHTAVEADRELHAHAAAQLAAADVLLFGRRTYQLMEEAFRPGEPDDVFARTIHPARKAVVSRTLESVDWNAELLRGDLSEEVARLKASAASSVFVGGMTLARSLTELRLIDEYVFVVHPVVSGHGPTLFDGLSTPLHLRLVGREELGSGAVALTYQRR